MNAIENYTCNPHCHDERESIMFNKIMLVNHLGLANTLEMMSQSRVQDRLLLEAYNCIATSLYIKTRDSLRDQGYFSDCYLVNLLVDAKTVGEFKAVLDMGVKPSHQFYWKDIDVVINPVVIASFLSDEALQLVYHYSAAESLENRQKIINSTFTTADKITEALARFDRRCFV